MMFEDLFKLEQTFQESVVWVIIKDVVFSVKVLFRKENGMNEMLAVVAYLFCVYLKSK